MVSTFQATPNIAVVKYWGKRDEKLVLPTNSSISMTLDGPHTITSVEFSPKLSEDEVWINGKKQERTGEFVERLQLLDAVRSRAKIKTKALIVSTNDFPTGAGFASSASGLAALACAASKAAGLTLSASELSIFARLGSGSASRSVIGGWVEWQKGSKPDGFDSIAVQLAPASHWPEIRLVSGVISEEQKPISSRAGMKATVATSSLYKERMQNIEQTLQQMRSAIKEKNFPLFAEITMRESSNMHAVMLDTWPPIIYLNDVSREVMRRIHELNEQNGIVAAYTFDAGPNPHIYTTSSNVEKVEKIMKEIQGIKKVMVTSAGSGPVELAKHLIKGGKPVV